MLPSEDTGAHSACNSPAMVIRQLPQAKGGRYVIRNFNAESLKTPEMK